MVVLKEKPTYSKMTIDYSGNASGFMPEGYSLSRVAHPKDPDTRIRFQIYRGNGPEDETFVGTAVQNYDSKKRKYSVTFEISSEDPKLLGHIQTEKRRLDARFKND